MPASLRSDYPIYRLVTSGPFSPEEGASFTGIRKADGLMHDGKVHYSGRTAADLEIENVSHAFSDFCRGVTA